MSQCLLPWRGGGRGGRRALPGEPEGTIPAIPGSFGWLEPGATPEPLPAASGRSSLQDSRSQPSARQGRRWACGMLCQGTGLK